MTAQLEEWRDLPGYEGHYQVSSLGNVKSLERRYFNKAGQHQRIPERIMRPAATENYRYLSLVLRAPDGQSRRTWKVHQLVARAFHGAPPFIGAEVCHADGDSLNNTAVNLRWDTRSANGVDSVRHGTNIQANKTHCLQGHEFTPENTIMCGPRLSRRRCRTCQRVHNHNYYVRKVVARRGAA